MRTNDYTMRKTAEYCSIQCMRVLHEHRGEYSDQGKQNVMKKVSVILS